MAVRNLRYCTHCGMPLLDGALAPAPDGRPAPDSRFCRLCGHPLRALAPQVPAPYLVPDRAPHPRRTPALLRWATALAIDLLLACLTGLLVAAAAAQVVVMVTGGSPAAQGPLDEIATLAGAAALLAYQPFFWLRHRPAPGRRLLGLVGRGDAAG